MNYFSHARRFLHDPYLSAGTAIPDWLGVLNRKVRARSAAAASLLTDPDPRVVSLAKGIVQHHFDDGWFHQTEAFYRLSGRLAGAVRAIEPADTSMRPSFVGHVLLELLLDDSLIQAQPEKLESYYVAIDGVDPHLIEATVNRISKVPADRLSDLIPRFVQERFLADYQTDAKLIWRMNHVLKRVGLPPLPTSDLDWVAESRELVSLHVQHLLMGEQDGLAADLLNETPRS